MFVDEVKVFARAGRGGKGCVAFHHETCRPKGGPSGGNGGRGGNVILQADHDLDNLIAQYYEPRLIAQSGDHGMGKGMDGRAGKDLVVKVPCGTLVWRLSTPAPARGVKVAPTEALPAPTPAVWPLGASLGPPVSGTSRQPSSQSAPAPEPPGPLPAAGHAPEGELWADLAEHGRQLVLCRGGRGGLGNRHFATSRRQAPRFAQPGQPGEEGAFLLELRLIAEVGLVGYPNAGKSTLLAAISRARPKIAPYPFTTLHPQIGIVEYPDWQRLRVCDAPGLIEGAHRNAGLGHAFLRHIERCSVLVLLLDMAGLDGRQPWDDYRQLLNELGLYDPALLAKPRLVAANKMDEPGSLANLKSFKRRFRKTPVLPIAAAFDQGIDRFKEAIREAAEGRKA
jgi:GTP-binding protein